MATEVVSTIRASGGDYTTLSAWEAGEQGDLTGVRDEIAVAECYDDWPSGLDNRVTILGWTCDSTRYVKITVADGHKHDGTPGTGFHIRQATGQSDATILVYETNTIVEWMDIVNPFSSGRGIDLNSSSEGSTIRYCLAKANNIGIRDGSTGNLIHHCLAYDGNGYGFRFDLAKTTQVAANCIASGNANNYYAATSGVVLKNCVSYGGTSTNYVGPGFDETNSTNNATSSGSDDAPGGNSVWGITSSDFVNSAANDFHIDSGSALYEAGTDLSGTFTTDIDGDTWATTWSIGFDQPAAGGGATPTLSSPTVTSIGQTTATPQVTVTFA